MTRLEREMTAFFAGLYPGESRTLVFGEGRADARTVFVGEAPGEQEALQGRPFVGKAGRNLDELLAIAGEYLVNEELPRQVVGRGFCVGFSESGLRFQILDTY